jgi:hypothetical protein
MEVQIARTKCQENILVQIIMLMNTILIQPITLEELSKVILTFLKSKLLGEDDIAIKNFQEIT